MTSKWQLDQEFLQKTIDDGYKIIKDPKTQKSDIPGFKLDIKQFEQYLQGNYEGIENDGTRPPKDIEKLKSYILRKMQRQYKTLGPELINWLIDLSYEFIFDSQDFEWYRAENKFRVETIDEQAELTLETYKKHSKKYYVPAKKIILDENPKQIQLIDDGSVGSYCWTNEINGMPVLIIDPSEASWILNHELQHGIEHVLNYDTPRYFTELGATYFELLFNDELYKQKGAISIKEYYDKLDEIEVLISTTAEYFETLQEIANRNFDVSTEKFLELFIENNDINPEDIYEFLRFDIGTSETESDMDYVFSYLKAIELREKSHSGKKDSADLLEPYINTNEFHFDLPQNGYAVYERFIEEVKEKTKTM